MYLAFMSFTENPYLLSCLISFIQSYKTRQNSEILRPIAVVEQLPHIWNSFQPGTQQCAAEFFQNLIHKLGCDQCGTSNKVIISDLFQITLRSEVMCSNCGYVSKTCSKETVLSLPVATVS